MIAVSDAFKTAIKATTRRFRPRLSITWIDSLIDSTIVCSSNDDNYVHPAPNGKPDGQVADGISVSSQKWAHLDGILLADGSYHPAPDNVQAAAGAEFGWYGATRCNGSAIWSGTYPTLKIIFAARAILSLAVSGDSVYNEYPVDFDIKIYAAGDVLLYTETLTGNALLNWTKPISNEGIIDAVRMDLIIKKWSAANRVAKITEFYTSIAETYKGDDIVSMNLLEEREIADGSLPIGNISANELDIELQNIKLIRGTLNLPDPFSFENDISYLKNLLKKNRRIDAELGLVLPGDKLYGEYGTDGVIAFTAIDGRDISGYTIKFVKHDGQGPGAYHHWDSNSVEIGINDGWGAQTTAQDVVAHVNGVTGTPWAIISKVADGDIHMNTFGSLVESAMFSNLFDLINFIAPDVGNQFYARDIYEGIPPYLYNVKGSALFPHDSFQTTANNVTITYNGNISGGTYVTPLTDYAAPKNLIDSWPLHYGEQFYSGDGSDFQNGAGAAAKGSAVIAGDTFTVGGTVTATYIDPTVTFSDLDNYKTINEFSIEYVPLGTFWSGDWKTSEKGTTASTSARDRMELLRNAEFSTSLIYSNINLYDLMEIVLNAAKTNIPMPDLTWNIDSELADYSVPIAYFPRQDYFKCIKQIVEACMGQAYMNRNDVLIITGPSFVGN